MSRPPSARSTAVAAGETAAIADTLAKANEQYQAESQPYVSKEATGSLKKALQQIASPQEVYVGDAADMKIWGTAGEDMTASINTSKENTLTLEANYDGKVQSPTGTFVSITLTGVSWNVTVPYGWISEDGQVGHVDVTLKDGNTVIEFYAPHFSSYVIGKATVPPQSTDNTTTTTPSTTTPSTTTPSTSTPAGTSILKDTSADVDLPLALVLTVGVLLLCGSAVVLKKRA